MRYDPSYSEHCRLRDGTEVLVRCVHPGDKALLRDGFARLSPESRYRRFLGSKASLSDAELRYLTEVDGDRHFALGAQRLTGGVAGEGLGIARFVRDAIEPEIAEAAIAVVDPAHGLGLGTLLLGRLVAAAVERGVRRFRCVVLASNDPMLRLFDALGLDAVTHHDRDLVLLDVPLPATTADAGAPGAGGGVPAESALSGLARLLRLAAEGVLSVRARLATDDHGPPPAAAEEPAAPSSAAIEDGRDP
ncbi:MAG: GNAT family N-acetyltransferase [Polyangiaceae bacterium]|nr:GNAT family N-acetyltransferase [Polyangiaceae bacterium]